MLDIIGLACYLPALLTILYGRIDQNNNIMLLAIIFALIGNMIYALGNLKRRMIFLLFNSVMFLFLIGRPIIDLVRGNDWWGLSSQNAINNSLISLFLALFLMFIGTCVAEKNFKQKNLVDKYNKIIGDVLIQKIQKIAMVLFYITIICTLIEGLEKIRFMNTHTYVQYYTSYATTQPSIVKALIQMMKPLMCIILATMPSKRKTIPVLILYIISTIPNLIVGMRSPTMLALFFAFSYYYVRDIIAQKDKRWIGHKERLAIIIIVPFLVAFLFTYNYIRSGREVDNEISKNMLVNFIYQQGNSFDVLVEGFDVLDRLPENKFPGYTLGPIYDSVVHNSALGRALFKTSRNNIQTKEALNTSHDMKSHLSYAIMGDAYFQGSGVGVVYILEIFYDFGWLGVIIYSFIMGIYLIIIVKYIFGNWIVSTICIYSLLQLFYTPRADAIYMFAQCFSPYFWITILACYFIAKINFGNYYIKKYFKFNIKKYKFIIGSKR